MSDCQKDPNINLHEGAILITGCDCAIIKAEEGQPVTYSYEKLVDHFHQHDSMSDDEEAREWVDYNILRALPYYGDTAPIIVGADYDEDDEGDEGCGDGGENEQD